MNGGLIFCHINVFIFWDNICLMAVYNVLIRWVRLFYMDIYMYKCLFIYILYIKIWKYTTTCPTKYKVPIYLLPKLEGSHKTCIYVCWIYLVLLWFFAFGTFIICCSVWIFVIEFNLFLHRQQLVLEGWNHPPFFFKLSVYIRPVFLFSNLFMVENNLKHV